MKHKGFTLAEILIVVTIVGILATILVKSSNTAIDKQKILLHKGYQTVERVLNELVTDETLYPYDPDHPNLDNMSEVTWITTGEKFGGTRGTIQAYNKLCALFAKKLNLIELGSGYPQNPYCGWIKTVDGIGYYVEYAPFESHEDVASIYIDIDGNDKGKNCVPKKACEKADDPENNHCSSYAVEGRKVTTCKNESEQDIFIFDVTPDGRMVINKNDTLAKKLLLKDKASKD